MKTITKLTTNVNNVQTLPDNPDLSQGYTPLLVKQTFDKAGSDIKTYMNDTMIEDVQDNFDEVVSTYATKSELSGVTLGQIPDNTITADKMVTDVQNQLEYAEIARLSSIYHNATKTNPQRTWMVSYSGSYIPNMTSNTQSGYTTSAVSNNSTA